MDTDLQLIVQFQVQRSSIQWQDRKLDSNLWMDRSDRRDLPTARQMHKASIRGVERSPQKQFILAEIADLVKEGHLIPMSDRGQYHKIRHFIPYFAIEPVKGHKNLGFSHAKVR